MTSPSKTTGRATLFFCIYLAVALGCLVWPGYALIGDRVEPYVLGLPFCFAWNVIWVLATFVATLLYHLAIHEKGAR